MDNSALFIESCDSQAQRPNSFCSNFNQDSGEPPSIEIECFDASPFSASSIIELESFSGIFDEEELERMRTAEKSFHLERIVDIQEIDPDWDDEEVDEILIISPKLPATINNLTQNFNRLSTIMEDLQELNKDVNRLSSISNFQLLEEKHTPGTTTTTYIVKKQDTRKTYIMKRFNTTSRHTWPFELSVLEMINDREAPFLPKIWWRVVDGSSFSVIMDSYPGGSLLEYVNENGRLSCHNTIFYASELVEALSVIHAAGIAHRNLNPENLMIDSHGHIVLVGFENTCIDVEDEHQALSISTTSEYEYRAPEILLEWMHDCAVDCWAFGCVVYWMMYGTHPFPVSEGNHDVLRGRTSYESDVGVPQVARELMQECIEANPAFRLTISEIKSHEFFAFVNWNSIHEKTGKAPYVPTITTGPLEQDAEDEETRTIRSVRKTKSCSSLSSCASPIVRSPSLSLSPCSTSVASPTSSISSPAPISPVTFATDWDVLQTPAPPYTRPLTSSSSTTIFSPKAREDIQELLPNIFRVSYDDPRPKRKSRTSVRSRSSTIRSLKLIPIEDYSFMDSEIALPSPAPTYDSLRRKIDVDTETQSLSPEEKMKKFWDSLDEDVNSKSNVKRSVVPASALGFRRSTNRLCRKPSLSLSMLTPSRSSLSLSNFNLSTLHLGSPRLSFAGFGNENTRSRLRSFSMVSLAKNQDEEKEKRAPLPKGVEHIGSGIGFTYRAPSPASIVPLPMSNPVSDVMARSRMKKLAHVPGRLKKWNRNLKMGLTLNKDRDVNKEKVEEPAEAVAGRMSCSSRFHSMEESVDVFQCGLMPDMSVRGRRGMQAERRGRRPVFNANATVNDSPFSDLGGLDGNAVPGTLKELGVGGRKTLRLVPRPGLLG